MKKLPFYLAVATIIGILIYLLPKVTALLLAILIAGAVPGTDVSINPMVMLIGAIAVGIAIIHKSLFIDLKLAKKLKKAIAQNSYFKKLSFRRFLHLKNS